MDRLQEGNVNSIQSLDQKLSKAHLDIAVLQAQHIADKQFVQRMASDIAEVIAIQEEMGCRLQRLSDCEENIRKTAERTKDLVMELGHDASSAPLEGPARTLDQELEEAEHPKADYSGT